MQVGRAAAQGAGQSGRRAVRIWARHRRHGRQTSSPAPRTLTVTPLRMRMLLRLVALVMPLAASLALFFSCRFLTASICAFSPTVRAGSVWSARSGIWDRTERCRGLTQGRQAPAAPLQRCHTTGACRPRSRSMAYAWASRFVFLLFLEDMVAPCSRAWRVRAVWTR